MQIRQLYKKTFFRVNLLFLSFVVGVILLANSQHLPLIVLFWPPPTPEPVSQGLLTHTFQLLCGVPPLVCAFTFSLLNRINPQNQKNNFFFFSAVIMGLFWINEIYRIHIIFVSLGLAKPLSIFVYALLFLIYLINYWKRLSQTNYLIFASGMILLAVAIAIDSLHLKNEELASILEGIPKLLSGANLALYFWDTCLKEILRTLRFFKNDEA